MFILNLVSFDQYTIGNDKFTYPQCNKTKYKKNIQGACTSPCLNTKEGARYGTCNSPEQSPSKEPTSKSWIFWGRGPILGAILGLLNRDICFPFFVYRIGSINHKGLKYDLFLWGPVSRGRSSLYFYTLPKLL